MSAGRTCRVCGYTRTEEDGQPEGQCPSCDRWYAKTDQLPDDQLAPSAGARPKKPVREQRTSRANANPPEAVEPPPQPDAASKRLRKCGDCDALISKRAESCPHCGAPTKRSRKRNAAARGSSSTGRIGKGIAVGAIGLIVVMCTVEVDPPDDSPARVTDAPAPEPCTPENASCWFDRHQIDLEVACKPAVAKYAKWDHEWTHGWLGSAFTRYRVEPNGTIFATGDELKLQNGFGAWQKQSYTCSYDPGTDTVLSATIR